MTVEALLVSIQTMLCFPGKLEQVTTRNKLTRKQLEEEENTHEKQASSWAEEDNEGVGLVLFQDLQLFAILTIYPWCSGLQVLVLLSKRSSTTVKIVAVMFLDLTVYCDKVHQEYDSTMKSIRFQKFSTGSRKYSIQDNKG